MNSDENIANLEIASKEIPLVISSTGLYSALPILAYRVLITAREHIAKDVLICLVSHLGKGKSSNKVWPSITTICKETARGRDSVIKAIRTLEEFEFVRKFKYCEQKGSKRKRNGYLIKDSCYHANLMPAKVTHYLPVFGRCGCGGIVRMGEYGVGSDGYHHYGCGDLVKPLKSKKNLSGENKSINSVGAELIMEDIDDTNFQYLQRTDSPDRGSENWEQ